MVLHVPLLVFSFITADTMNHSCCHLISNLTFLTLIFSFIFFKIKKKKTLNLKLSSVPWENTLLSKENLLGPSSCLISSRDIVFALVPCGFALPLRPL